MYIEVAKKKLHSPQPEATDKAYAVDSWRTQVRMVEIHLYVDFFQQR